LRRRKNLRGRRSGFAGAALYVGYIWGDLDAALGRLLNVAGDLLLLRRRTLFFNGRGDGRKRQRRWSKKFPTSADSIAYVFDGTHRLLGGRLDALI
jgi:hypothetical protein